MLSYRQVELNGSPMGATQAAGLAVELAHKLVCRRVKSVSEISEEDVSHVKVSGDSVKAHGRRQPGGVDLPLQSSERKLAVEVFKAQRQLLGSLHINAYTADVRRQGGSHDLVADFSKEPYPVVGFLSNYL